jgi:hypothetical protein
VYGKLLLAEWVFLEILRKRNRNFAVVFKSSIFVSETDLSTLKNAKTALKSYKIEDISILLSMLLHIIHVVI